jgi:hypothetical protein
MKEPKINLDTTSPKVFTFQDKGLVKINNFISYIDNLLTDFFRKEVVKKGRREW